MIVAWPLACLTSCLSEFAAGSLSILKMTVVWPHPSIASITSATMYGVVSLEGNGMAVMAPVLLHVVTSVGVRLVLSEFSSPSGSPHI